MSDVSNKERLRQEFLAKARDAEHRAAQANDADGRACWLKIAEGYRDLAQRQDRLRPG